MPRTVEIAVNMIGRKRVLLASTVACQTLLPSLRSASICPIRITAFLVIIPSSAKMPRMATNPSGQPDSNRAATTPINPGGPTLRTINSREKLRNYTIRTVNMISNIAGTTAMTEACAFALSSTTPPVTIR